MENIINLCPKNELSRRSLIEKLAMATLGVSVIKNSPLEASSKAKRKIFKPSERRLVEIFISGGMSHIDSWDPKPDAGSEIMGPTTTIRANTGILLSEFMPNMAKQMDKIALIRSMQSPEGDHGRGSYLFKTSYPKLGTISHPNIGAWTNHILGGINPALPANVSIGSGGGGGYLGARATPFNVVDINDPFGSLMPENAFSNAYREQLNLVIALGQNFRKKIRNADVQSVSDSYNQAIKLMSSDDIHAFDTSLEDKETQASYGKMGQKLLLGRRLIESGVRHVGIDFGGWDDHDDLWGNFPSRAMSLDRVLSVFLQDMEKRGLLKNTTIAFKTEFGRTPVHKDKKGLGSGRDHYPKAFSTWMAGAGVKKGFVYGATDARGEFPLENIVTPMDYNATLAKIMGISLGKEIYSPDNRPFTIARDGQPIMDILA